MGRWCPRIPGGTCSFFAGRTGLFGSMSIARVRRGACPAVGVGSVGTCSFFAGRTGLLGSMSIARLRRGHVRRWVRARLGVLMPGCLDGWMSRQRAGTMSIPSARRRTGSYSPEVGRGAGEHVQPLMGLRGMFRSLGGHRGACSFFAGRTGRNGTMSSPRVQRGACPPEEPWDGVGRAQLGEAGKFRYSSICF